MWVCLLQVWNYSILHILSVAAEQPGKRLYPFQFWVRGNEPQSHLETVVHYYLQCRIKKDELARSESVICILFWYTCPCFFFQISCCHIPFSCQDFVNNIKYNSLHRNPSSISAEQSNWGTWRHQWEIIIGHSGSNLPSQCHTSGGHYSHLLSCEWQCHRYKLEPVYDTTSMHANSPSVIE